MKRLATQILIKEFGIIRYLSVRLMRKKGEETLCFSRDQLRYAYQKLHLKDFSNMGVQQNHLVKVITKRIFKSS